MVKPRIHLRQKGEDRLGREAVELAASAGLELDDWQQHVLVESMREKGGRWVAREVGVNVARQNGKNAILEARELAELYLVRSPVTIHSAHLFDTSLEHFNRMRGLIEETPRLAGELLGGRRGVKSGHGEEGFYLKGDRRLRFRTRTKGGGRGFTADLIVLDEAMVLSEMSMAALFPTKRARPNPQVWYTGSAVDQLTHEHGLAFSRVRKRAIGGANNLVYFEWSVEGDDPSAVPRDVLEDRAAWAQANPALGIRIDADTMAEELESLDSRTFAVELLGIGDWPDPDFQKSVLDARLFAELQDDRSKVEDPVCFAFDVSPERFSSVAAAGRRADGLWHIEVIASRRGTSWVPEYLAERVRLHKPSAVVCDGYGPAASLLPACDTLGVEVQTLTAGEHAKACGQFVDAVEEKTVRFPPDLKLVDAVRAAKTRPLGDAWAWSRKSSTSDISPLVAVTLALSAAVTAPADGKVLAWL